jgi:hypothetical protein
VRDKLALLTPMAATDLENPEDAFAEHPFLRFDRRIVAIMVSADADLLTLETTDKPAPGKDSSQPRFGGDGMPANAPMIQINFYRLSTGEQAPDKLVPSAAGVLAARVALALPMTSVGFLNVIEGGRDRWLFNFNSHAGKVSELAEFDTTCYPRTVFVSHSEFVAFGCRGTADKQDIAGFNLNGDAIWQQNFFDTHTTPTFSFAPAAGRFALERTIVGSAPNPGGVNPESDATSQEVRVYQMYNGKMLLRTVCSPVVTAGQNFALSPDGTQLAVLHETLVQHRATEFEDAYTARTGTVEIYTLPPLTAKDQAAVKQAAGFAPPDTGERVDLTLVRLAQAAAAKASDASVPKAAPASAAKAGTTAVAMVPEADSTQRVDQSSPQAENPAASGDAPPEAPRKPPTLYGPGETPSKPQ